MRKNQYGFPPINDGMPQFAGRPATSVSTPADPPPVAPPNAQPVGQPTLNPTAAPLPAPPTDYLQNILNDPLYKQQLADLSAQGIQSASQRKAATDRALIQFGEIPNFTNAINGLGLDPNSAMFNFLKQDVDEGTMRGAAGLTNSGLSTVAKLATGHKTALDSLMSTLAARGIVRSGATGVGVGLENQNYLNSQFTARNQLLDYLSGVQSAFTQAQQGQWAQQAADAQAAAARQAQVNPGTDTSGTWSPAINGYIPDSQWFGASPGINYYQFPWEGH